METVLVISSGWWGDILLLLSLLLSTSYVISIPPSQTHETHLPLLILNIFYTLWKWYMINTGWTFVVVNIALLEKPESKRFATEIDRTFPLTVHSYCHWRYLKLLCLWVIVKNYSVFNRIFHLLLWPLVSLDGFFVGGILKLFFWLKYRSSAIYLHFSSSLENFVASVEVYNLRQACLGSDTAACDFLRKDSSIFPRILFTVKKENKKIIKNSIESWSDCERRILTLQNSS